MSNKKPIQKYDAEVVSLTEFRQDTQNANMGTEDGSHALEQSLSLTGLGRGIVVDKHGNIIAGNKTQEQALMLDLTDAIVVKSDGKKLVVIQRDDLDLYDESPENIARRMAYFDNRSGELNLHWDKSQLIRDMASLDDDVLKAAIKQIAYEHSIDLDDDTDYDLGEIDFDQFAQVGDVNIRYQVVISDLSYDEAQNLAMTHPNAEVKQYRKKGASDE